MEIKVTAKHMDLTPAIEEYAVKKMDKLRRFFDRILQVEVIVDRTKNEYSVEIITDVEGHNDFIATATHEDLYAGVDLALDRAVRQIHDYKSKLRDNKHNQPTGGAGIQ